MRRFVIASHHRLAWGLKDTLEFLTASRDIRDISAYVDDQELEGQIQKVFDSFEPDDEVVMMTDMLGGSVNQKFYPYMGPGRHLICGVNLPCALALLLAPDGRPLGAEEIQGIVEEARQHLIYVNQYDSGELEGDE